MRTKHLLTKILLAVALLAGGSNAWANDTFGALTGDDATFAERSQTYTLAGYGTYNFTFTTTNAADGTDYHTWTLIVRSGDDATHYFSCWGTTYAYQGAHSPNSNANTDKMTATSDYATKNPGGAGIQSAMNGATVNMAITRKSGNITVVSNVTPSNGENAFTLIHQYLIGDATADNLHFKFATECTTMDISSASKSQVNISAATATSTAMKDYVKYEFLTRSDAYAAQFLSGGTWTKSDGNMSGVSTKGFKTHTAGRYVKAILTKPLSVGDVITVYAYTDNANNKISVGTGFANSTTNDCNLWVNFPANCSTSDPYRLSYTVTAGDDFENHNNIVVGLGGNGNRPVHIHSIYVTTNNPENAATTYPLEGKSIWTFGDMDVETYTSNQVIDNLYVGANETYNSGIIEDSRTINGTVYTKALILNKNDLGNINSKDNNSANKYGCLFVKLPDGPGTVKLTYYNNGSAGDIAYCFSKYSSTQRSYSGISTNGYGVLEVPYSDSDSRYLYLYLHGNYITQIYLYKIEVVPQVTKTISSAGWATYCSPYALDFTNAIDNLEAAYMVTGGDNSVVTLSGITGTIPANTGILLKGEGECAIPVVASSATNVDENKLVGVTANTEIAAGAGYVLLNGDSGIGFYKNPDAAFTVGANTAYLPADFDGTGAREFFLPFGNEKTGIGATLNEKADMRNDQLFYNLNGQRVAQPSKGLYIVGGKKVIVK